jgi:hypothetical protein
MDGEKDFLVVVARIVLTFHEKEAELAGVAADGEVCASGNVVCDTSAFLQAAA